MSTARKKLSLVKDGSTPDGAIVGADSHEHRFLETFGQGACVFDATAGLAWSSSRFASLDEETQRRVTEVCAQAIKLFNQTQADSSNNTKSTGEAGHGLRVVIQDSKSERFYEVMVSPYVLAGQAAQAPISAVAAVLWDVTDSKQTELKLDAIDRAGAELVRLDPDVVRTLNAAQRLTLLEQKIVRYAHDRMDFDHFTIHLLNKSSNRLELVMSEGLPPEVQEVDLYAGVEGNGIIGYVAATGRSYLCRRITSDAHYIQGLERAGSCLTAPLLLNEDVIGVFNIESENVDAFSETDRKFAETFARYVALAFHILDLLVVERYTTGQTVSSTMEGEINEPLADLQREAEWLQSIVERDPEAADHSSRILRDIDTIRRHMTDVRRGPRSILGVDEALKEPAVDPLLEGRRILVVDDELGIRKTIGDILQRRGAIVEIYSSGDEAIAAIKAAFGKGGAGLDLLISDIKLEDRTGYEVYSEAKRIKPDLSVMLMTGFGYDPHHSIVRASQDGLQCVLFKPFRAQRLLDEVRATFRQDNGEDPAPDEK